MLLVILWWKHGRLVVRDVACLLPFFALAIALALVTIWMETHHLPQGERWDQPFVGRLLLAGRAIWFYAGKLAWPQPLVFFYPCWTIDPGQIWQYLYVATAVSVPIALAWQRKRWGRGPLAAVLIFGGILLPALGFINIYYMLFAQVSAIFNITPTRRCWPWRQPA